MCRMPLSLSPSLCESASFDVQFQTNQKQREREGARKQRGRQTRDMAGCIRMLDPTHHRRRSNEEEKDEGRSRHRYLSSPFFFLFFLLLLQFSLFLLSSFFFLLPTGSKQVSNKKKGRKPKIKENDFFFLSPPRRRKTLKKKQKQKFISRKQASNFCFRRTSYGWMGWEGCVVCEMGECSQDRQLLMTTRAQSTEKEKEKERAF